MTLFVLAIFLLIARVSSISLQEAACKIRSDHCKSRTQNDEVGTRSDELKRNFAPPPSDDPVFLSDDRPRRPHNFDSWSLYPLEAGTGYGPAGGPGYGPGMGDIAISTGVGVQTGIGGLGIQNGLGVGFGGSGRMGGMPFGFGNGFGATGNGRYLNGK